MRNLTSWQPLLLLASFLVLYFNPDIIIWATRNPSSEPAQLNIIRTDDGFDAKACNTMSSLISKEEYENLLREYSDIFPEDRSLNVYNSSENVQVTMHGFHFDGRSIEMAKKMARLVIRRSVHQEENVEIKQFFEGEGGFLYIIWKR